MDGTSTTRTIISRAVSELRTHATKLEEVHTRASEELTEANAFIKAVEKVFRPKAGRSAPSPSAPPRLPAGDSPRKRFTGKVVALLEDGPRSLDSIVNHFGSSAAYVQSIIDNSDQLVQVGNEVRCA